MLDSFSRTPVHQRQNIRPITRFPEYDHDKDHYRAVCKWLGYEHGLPEVPLPPLVYNYVAGFMRPGDNGVPEFNNDFAAAYIERAAYKLGIDLEQDLPPRSFALFLKNIFRGMHQAAKEGMTEGPAFLGISANTNYYHIVTSPDKAGTMIAYFCHLNNTAKELNKIEPLLDKESGDSKQAVDQSFYVYRERGFRVQSRSHLQQVMPENTTPEALADAIDSATFAWRNKYNQKQAIRF